MSRKFVVFLVTTLSIVPIIQGARTYIQNYQVVQESALGVLNKDTRTDNEEIISAIDAQLNIPFRLFATTPTPDSVLNIGSNQVDLGDGAGLSSPPAASLVNTFVASTIDFQTPGTTGGTILVDNAAFALPTCTVGQFRRYVLAYDSVSNSIDSTFSAEVASEGSLANAGSLFDVISGNPIGFIDLECTNASGLYKTAGSSTDVIENSVSNNPKIYRFGSGAGGGPEELSDLDDIDVTTVVPSLGQGLVWDGSQFVPGQPIQEINYINDPDAEINASAWNTYADAAQSTPEDGTAGTANIVFSAQDTVALRGSYSFKIAKDAFNRQGEGVSTDFTIKEQDTSKKLKIQFDFKTDEDAGYASGDLKVYIYDVTNSTLITPVDTNIIRGVNIFQTSFNSTTSTSYRLIFHVATTNASAWDAYIDNVIVGPGMTSQGAAIGAWTSYTPSNTAGLGTITSRLQYRRVGGSIEIFGDYDTGTPTATEAQLGLPDGLTIGGTASGTIVVGYSQRDNAVALQHLLRGVAGETYMTIYRDSVSNYLTATGDNGSSIYGSGERQTVWATMPIQEWQGKGIVPMLAEDNLSEWVDFTPEFDNDSGTPTVNLAKKRRVGSNLEMKIRVSNANSNGSDYRLNLPDSLTPIADNPPVGVLFRGQITNVFEAKVGTGDIEFISGGAKLGTDYTFTADTLDIDVSVPVVEYQGSQNSLVGYSLASETQTGLMSTGTQTIAGQKTFGDVKVSSPKPSFFVYNSSNDLVTSNTWVDVTFDTEVHDLQNNFASNVFTVPEDGQYLINAHVNLKWQSTGTIPVFGAAIVATGYGYINFGQTPGHTINTTSQQFAFHASVVLNLSQGDTVRVQTISTSTDYTVMGSSEKPTYISGHLLL